MRYAGFGLRLCAIIIDGFIIYPCYCIFVALITFSPMHFFAFQAPLAAYPADIFGKVLLNSSFAILSWLYFALLESSEWQGTVGKKLLKIKVTDLYGGRLSFARATGRYFGKFISTVIFYIGFIMAAFTEKKQALHDIMANTLVVKND